MAVVVLPYQGHAQAQKGAPQTGPQIRTKNPPRRRDPLEGLDMRITYRTVRVLMAIAERPGASNRLVAAEAAGISDQGQISKLLARLEPSASSTTVASAPSRERPTPGS